uniref:Uncharacterized protein n=1 Tax=Aegilops tauschii TaxID=37682 RepID=M8C164_AEGTA
MDNSSDADSRTGVRRATVSSTGWSTCGRRTTPTTSPAAAYAASTAAPSTRSATTSASAPPRPPSPPAPPPSKPTAARSASPSSPPPPPSAPTAPHASSPALDVCARVCVVDEHEAILYESFVKPLIPVTHYRYETTGIRPEHLRDAPTVKQAMRRVQDILLNGEQSSSYSSRGAARLLVGRGLEHDLDALGMDYPAHLKRDTAT